MASPHEEKHESEGRTRPPGLILAGTSGLVGGLVALLVGFGLGVFSGDGAGQSTPSGQHAGTAGSPGSGKAWDERSERETTRLKNMKRSLDAGERERSALLSRIEALESELARLAEASEQADSGVAQSPLVSTATRDPAQPKPGGRAARKGPNAWFNPEELERAGMSPRDSDSLRESWEAYTMEKLYLADERKRYPTMKPKQYQSSLLELEEDFRAEVGEEGYDAVLYATGRNNRVVARSVLEDSPARKAGMEAGDQVVRYAGQRIYSAGELKKATAEGDPDELIVFEVLRDGRILTLRVRRGPMGIMLEERRAAPVGG